MVRLKKFSLTLEEKIRLKYQLRRYILNCDIVRRRATHISQKCLFVQEEMNDWKMYVLDKIANLSDDFILNFDETNIQFDTPSTYTLAKKGSKTINMKTTGNTQRCTVILTCSKSGIKLKPYIIFKASAADGKVAKEVSKFPDSVICNVQSNAWVDEDILIDYVNRVLKPYLATTNQAYLIMDECTAHKTKRFRRCLEDNNLDYEYILPGYTPKLQVLDVGVNGPFKHYYKVLLNTFLNNNNYVGKITRERVAEWIVGAWDSITPETITNTWTSILQVSNNNNVYNNDEIDNNNNISFIDNIIMNNNYDMDENYDSDSNVYFDCNDNFCD